MPKPPHLQTAHSRPWPASKEGPSSGAIRACVTLARRSAPAVRRLHALVEDPLDFPNTGRAECNVLALTRHTPQDVLQLLDPSHRRRAALNPQLGFRIRKHNQTR